MANRSDATDKVRGPSADEPFLQRFHRRKTEAREQERAKDAEGAIAATAGPRVDEQPPPQPLTDADMPPLESLTIDSDFSAFLSEKVSESLRRAALRKLFHSSEFNVVDGLDEYAEDFTTFEALGDIITADMRHQLEIEARKKAEAMKDALLEDERESSQAPADDHPTQAALSETAVPPDAADHEQPPSFDEDRLED